METIVLKNVKLKWPYLAKPNDVGEYASGKYQVDIVLAGDNLKTVEGLLNKKQKIKEKDGEKVVTLKSSVKPHVYNKVKALMSDEEIKQVGNGSVAHVKVTQYDTKYGTFLGLGAIKVVEVSTYTGGEADFGDDDDVTVAASTDDDEELI